MINISECIKFNFSDYLNCRDLIKLGQIKSGMDLSNKISEQNYSWATLLLRLVSGGFMLTHGLPKLKMLMAGSAADFADPIGLGPTFSLILTVFAEFLCAIFILIGFKTKLSTIPLMITMLVATFVVHLDDPFKKQEFPLLYFGIYAALFLLGSGKFSVDALLNKNKNGSV